MNKIILILALALITVFAGTQATFAKPQFLAKATEVQAITPFSTDKPSKTFEVKVTADSELADGTVLKAGYRVMSDVEKVKDPKRLKKNASFTLRPKYYVDNDGIRHEFEHEVYAKYTTTLDKKQAAKSAALTVGNHFVKGLSMGVAAIEGAVKNEEDNRLKSSGKSLYKASPLSYVEKGQSIILEAGDDFLLKFKMPDLEDEDDEPNYDYTMPEDTMEPIEG